MQASFSLSPLALPTLQSDQPRKIPFHSDSKAVTSAFLPDFCRLIRALFRWLESLFLAPSSVHPPFFLHSSSIK
jgi:hypothetical protein